MLPADSTAAVHNPLEDPQFYNLLLETFDQDHHLSMDDYDRLNLFDISLLEVEDLILSTWRWRRKERWKERTWKERVVDPVD